MSELQTPVLNCSPLNAQTLTTLIPAADILPSVLSMSSSEFNVGNQYALVPTNVNWLLSLDKQTTAKYITKKLTDLPFTMKLPFASVEMNEEGGGTLCLTVIVRVGVAADASKALRSTSTSGWTKYMAERCSTQLWTAVNSEWQGANAAWKSAS